MLTGDSREHKIDWEWLDPHSKESQVQIVAYTQIYTHHIHIHCSFMGIGHFAASLDCILFCTLSIVFALLDLVWAECPLLNSGLLFPSVACANPLEELCSLQPSDLSEFPLHTLKGACCHSAQVAGSPGTGSGRNIQSLLGRRKLLLTGVWEHKDCSFNQLHGVILCKITKHSSPPPISPDSPCHNMLPPHRYYCSLTHA